MTFSKRLGIVPKKEIQIDSIDSPLKNKLFNYFQYNENSIKESITAVESQCYIITGETGLQATLGKTIKYLKDNGVTIQKAFVVYIERQSQLQYDIIYSKVFLGNE